MVAKPKRKSRNPGKSGSKGGGRVEVEDRAPPPAAVEAETDDQDDDAGDDQRLTLEALDAMSDDDDSDNDDDASGDDGDGDGDGDEGDDHGAEAEALRRMIQDGKFDGLLKNAAKKKEEKPKKDDGKKAGGSQKKGAKMSRKEESEEDDDEPGSEGDDSSDEEVGAEEAVVVDEEGKNGAAGDNDSDDDDDSGSDSDEKATPAQHQDSTRERALATAVDEADRRLPWPETFAIVPPTPLPFGPLPEPQAGKRKRGGAQEDEDEDEAEYVDVHDDLKREVAFYDCALEAATLARERCEVEGIPFGRPDDFFAEMVKSDDHMAKIKDRLIFETKKMEAVERRKSNKEQTVMAKERQAHRLSEKSKAKKAHMSEVENWRKSAERSRGGLGGKVAEDDEERLRGMGGGGNKRMAANRKFGHGGKRGRFKQNDASTMNDMSGYNPRGGFGGIGQKGQAGGKKKGGGGGGNKRPGKRARDAKR